MQAYHSSFDGVNFHAGSLQSSSFQFDSFAGADFSGANLENTTFEEVSFAGANFAGADLSNANISHCNFRGAIFTNVNLTATFFILNDLTGATFSNVTIEKADMMGTTIAANSGPVYGVANQLPDHMKSYAGYLEWDTIDGNPPRISVRAPITSIP